jgi:hypothetical protein
MISDNGLGILAILIMWACATSPLLVLSMAYSIAMFVKITAPFINALGFLLDEKEWPNLKEGDK